MATENKDIKYINKDFGELRNALIEYTKTYFPSTYNDFSPSSPGMLFLEMSAYVGDVMSFYLDNQIQENFIQFARQQNNLYTLAYMLGYRPKVTGVALAAIDIYQQVPAKLNVADSTWVPDFDYAIQIAANTTLASNLNGATGFVMQDPVDFAFSSSADPTQITIYSTVGDVPDFFLLKKTRNAISANVTSVDFSFGSPERFQTIEINDANIIQVLDIVDSDNNEWYEVPYLAQETIYDTITNTNPNDSGEVPYLLQLLKVSRRFVSRFTSPTTLQIQFGAGTNTSNFDATITPTPNLIGLNLTISIDQRLFTAYDPANFLYTGTYGIAPNNTTLTVRYLTGGGVAANVPANSITSIIDTTNITIATTGLDPTLQSRVLGSVAITNPLAATGGKDGDTTDELRFNSLAAFGTQLRTVTQDDYLVRALSLPSQYGSISKIYLEPEKLENILPGETPSTLDLYVLAYDVNKKLKPASNALKQNLKTYLSQYRMINDTIRIRDGYTINIGIEFDIIVLPEYNNSEVLISCINVLKSYFEIDKWQMNEPIILRDLYIMLDKLDGVQTIKTINITNKVGINLGYSPFAYDIASATQNNTIYPSLDPMIFEVKYPDSDIKGRIVSL
jgi:hypothetical protein